MEWIYGLNFGSDTQKNGEGIPLMRKFVDQNWLQIGHFEFALVEFFYGIPLPETEHFVR